MKSSIGLMTKRRFAPLFTVQFLGAFNDNLFRTSMVLLVIFGIYDDPTREASLSAIAGGLFILPFVLFSAFAGSLADHMDKSLLIRRIKTAEILIMCVGALGLVLQSVPLLLLTLAATGLQSAFFGPIKYAIIPQHLEKDEVLGGTGMVQAGTYVAILCGTLLGGALLVRIDNGGMEAGQAAIGVLVVAALGRFAAQYLPPAPPQGEAAAEKPDWNIVRASVRVTREVMSNRIARLAIWAISIFWALGAVLLAQFPPLVKNGLGGDEGVATAFLAIFSVGVAGGSILVNRLLGGRISARFAPWAAIGMGVFVLDLYRRLQDWTPAAELLSIGQFLDLDGGWWVALDLFGLALMGGAYVVPLYAYLTTHVPPSLTARAIAVNNIVNSGLMVAGSLALTFAVQGGITIVDSLLGIVGVAFVAAYLGRRLDRAS
ncbi:MFS transporter [Sphingomicrobium sediminis]|uniref:MFS transporter n=1 Tax=Sphingomicrobium sediminis TaxID=2950949 RepID=A0A9X2J3J0_9SPHN|nr:MFS transporter [Sphingomicrobium sediminis]MCM8557351.1 MFS transporter [Sphingomicrobium sediminis]